MSWPTWPTTGPPLPTPAAQPTLLPTPVNSAPSVLPPGLQYSPEQWAQAQQQNWQQWAQWQQQYQQWHQQYGAEYQKSLTAMQTTVPATQPPLPAIANVAVAPPLPENRPPLPPEEPPMNQAYASLQTKQIGYSTAPLTTAQPPPSNRPAWPQKRTFGQESEVRKPLLDQWAPQKEMSSVQTNYSQPPPQTTPKANIEELSEAEKKFDKEFAAWEAQFQKWKEQNANHPDKTQYREYEKKWESWRNSLLERREQMRKKRLALAGGVGAVGGSKPPNFTQPPPNINQLGTNSNQQSVTNQTSYGGLNPNENNEALSFKKQTEPMTSENSFLKTTSSSTGIPGLDLVKGSESEFDTDNKDLPNKGPDLEAISKGINNILGDQKLLNMLSMVTKHPPPAPGAQKFDFSSQPPVINYQDTQYGNMTNPPPVAAHRDNFNDQSNQSFEEKSNYVDYHQREAVTNFDDQTRSSFTMGINDSDQSFKSRGRFGDDRLGGNFGSSFPRGNVSDNLGPKSLLSLSFPPGGPKIMKDDYGGTKNILPEPHAMGGVRNNFGQTKNDNFKQRTYDSSNRFPPKKDFYSGGYERDNFQEGNGRHQYNRHMDTDSKNLSGEYNQDYDNYGDEEDYDKYHDIFNEGDQDYNDDNNYGHNNRDDFTNKNQYQQQFSNEKMVEEIPNRDAVIPPEPEQIPPEEPIFQPSKVIDYEHKSLRQSDIEVAVEPVHMFDYRHKPLNRIPLPQRPKWLSESVKFIREFDPLASRIYERPMLDRMDRPPPMDNSRFDLERNYHEFEREGREYDRGRRNYERDSGSREDHRGQLEREGSTYRNEKSNNYDERDRKRIKLDRESRKDNKDPSDDKLKKRSEKSNLKDDLEELSDEDMDWEAGEKNKPSNQGDTEVIRSRSSSPILSNPPNPSNVIHEIQTIEDIINPPGRFSRPPRIVIILRGPPGSGKTYLARLIKDKEVDNGGSAPRILSLDDYFMVEHEKSVVEDGKNVTVKEMVYEYEAEMEESYRSSFIKSFKKTITDGYFPFIIVDNVNDKVKYFGEMWSFAKQNGFQVYICQMDLDPVLCTKRNIHNRTEAEIEEIIAEWEPTPSHHPAIDATGFLQQNQIKEVEMEIVPENITEEEPNRNESAEDHIRSKWDTFDYSSNNLAKLDGVSKPLRKSSRTMEEYLQMEGEWEPPRSSKPGQKRVRWADLEEQRELEKMKAMGFVVGHTDWNRMMDPTTSANRALTQTKYI